MSTIYIDEIIEGVHGVVDSLEKTTDKMLKSLQEFADSVAPDPQENNEHYVFAMPKQFYARCYGSLRAYDFGSPYEGAAHDYGNQRVGYYYDVELNEGSLTITHGAYLGKLSGGDWTKLTNDEITELEARAGEYPLVTQSVSSYPDEAIKIYYTSYLNYYFVPETHSNTANMKKRVNYVREGTYYESTGLLCKPTTQPTMDSDTGLITGINNASSPYMYFCYKRPFMMVTSDLSSVTDYVSANGATHNYVVNYPILGGTMKLYYGDNYIIYYIPTGCTVTYDLIYNATKDASVVINTDNPSQPPINPKTYQQNKITPEPEHGSNEDDIELLTTGFTNNIGGMGGYFLMSLNELSQLFVDFNTNAPEGTMFSQNILSCYVNGLDYNWQTSSQTIQIHSAGAKKTPFTSASNYDLIYNFNPTINAGTINVPRCTETFYDFSPYTTYELYIPFCGWIALPDTVAGRAINVELQCDVATMTCTAFVKFVAEDGDSTLCGQITGSIGAPCPIQVVEGGLYRQAHVNAGLQVATGAMQAVAGAMAQNNMAVVTGASQAMSGLNSMAVASNTNYGQTIGRAGDSSAMAGGHNCYLKITHPVVDSVVEEEMFGHTVGYLCNEIGVLSDFHGFTVCLNPHINIECTGDERDEIKRMLEQGVILP